MRAKRGQTSGQDRQQWQSAPQADTQQILGRSLPANIDAERSVLGSLLLNDECMGTIAEILCPDDFYSPAHRVLFQVMLDLVQSHKRIDFVTMQDELSKRNQLEMIGGVVYLVSLQEDIPTVGLYEQHAKLVKEKSVLRALIGSATGIISNCYSQDEKNIEAVLDSAEKTIFEIANKRTKQSFVQLDIWLKKTFQHLSDIKSHAKGITGTPSGLKSLDLMTSGFQKGDFIVLAARPSMGRSSWGTTASPISGRASSRTSSWT